MKIGELLQSMGKSSDDLSNNIQGNDTKNSFANMLENSIKNVNTTQIEAYNTMEALATGKVDNLQAAIQKLEEAELSLKLALEVKNKALMAYKEVMRMQV